MVVKIETCAIAVFQFRSVTVETDLSPQLPSFSLVGLASSMTQESRERVRAAVCNSGFEWPGRKITINLVPADLPKWGSHFELPMALSIILAGIDREEPWPAIFTFGELSLSGEIRPSRLGPALGAWLRKRSSINIVVAHPQDLSSWNPNEHTNVLLIPAASLKEAAALLLKSTKRWRPGIVPKAMDQTPLSMESKIDLTSLAAVEDEPLAVLCALVALANDRHHLLLAGAHGVGKSMIARAISQAQGICDGEEIAERGFVDQAFGGSTTAPGQKPVVFLQATMTRAALEGSVQRNGQALPGELSRAHGGLLIMDEFLEFRRDALECLRQPMEEGFVRLQRAQFRAQLPSRFQLIATTNLCPCGHWNGFRATCRCRAVSLDQYHRKLSGPLLDRFDLITVLGRRADWRRIVNDLKSQGLVNRLLQPQGRDERILNARRDLDHKKAEANPSTPSADPALSRRGLSKVAGVARTLAALDKSPTIESCHAFVAGVLRENMERVINNKSIIRAELFDA